MLRLPHSGNAGCIPYGSACLHKYIELYLAHKLRIVIQCFVRFSVFR